MRTGMCTHTTTSIRTSHALPSCCLAAAAGSYPRHTHTHTRIRANAPQRTAAPRSRAESGSRSPGTAARARPASPRDGRFRAGSRFSLPALAPTPPEPAPKRAGRRGLLHLFPLPLWIALLPAQQHSSTAAQQHSSTAAQQHSSTAAQQQSSRAAEQQSSRAAEQQSSRAAERHSSGLPCSRSVAFMSVAEMLAADSSFAGLAARIAAAASSPVLHLSAIWLSQPVNNEQTIVSSRERVRE